MARPKLTFLTDLVQAISGADKKDRATVAVDEKMTRLALSRPAPERLIAACDVLMGRIGDAARVAVAEQALEAYAELNADEKAAFFAHLRDGFNAEPDAIRTAFAAYDSDPTAATLVPLFNAVEPPRQSLLRRLNTAPNATLKLVHMRADLLAAMRKDPSLAPLDADFEHLFASWFNRGFLRIERVDWSTPASVLEKIMGYETVHPMKGWEDLRRRLDPNDRRFYAFFHPATGNEPLIFVEVALMRDIPDEIAPILTAPRKDLAENATTAVFYSINNTLQGLKGVSFGNFLIKQVAMDLSRSLQNVKTFVTLSPVPGFNHWLAQQVGEGGSSDHPDAVAISAVLSASNEAELAGQAGELTRLAAEYLCLAKRADGHPADPVARFHLGNGARLEQIHAGADLSEKGIAASSGVMVNYLYDLNAVEANHEAYAQSREVIAARPVRALLRERAASGRKAHGKQAHGEQANPGQGKQRNQEHA